MESFHFMEGNEVAYPFLTPALPMPSSITL
jgi:hypothetical protein